MSSETQRRDTEARRKHRVILEQRPAWSKTKQGELTADEHEDLAYQRKRQFWRRQEYRIEGERRTMQRLIMFGDYCTEIRLYCSSHGRVNLITQRNNDTGSRRVVAEGARTLFGYQFEAEIELLEPEERLYFEFEQPLEQNVQCVYQVLYLEWDLRHALLTAEGK